MPFVMPQQIRQYLRDQYFTLDDVGLSDSTILLTEKYALKISTLSAEALNEAFMLQDWLPGKLPVPSIIEVAKNESHVFVLMERLNSLSAAAPSARKDARQLMQALAQALKQLWSLDITTCPSDQRLSQTLEQARTNLLQNRVDILQAEKETFRPNGFKDPKALLKWLEDQQPQEDLVFSHGDFCLPNIFFSDDLTRVSGYIDLGRAGIADKYRDIALVYRSLSHNFAGVYDNQPITHADPAELFSYLELEPDWEKLKYYILLDEFF